MIELHLNTEHKESQKLADFIKGQAKKLKHALSQAQTKDEKFAAVFAYYRKYYTLTLNKASTEAGINRSPTRDNILDYPWKELDQDRFFCLKIWEKINR